MRTIEIHKNNKVFVSGKKDLPIFLTQSNRLALCSESPAGASLTRRLRRTVPVFKENRPAVGFEGFLIRDTNGNLVGSALSSLHRYQFQTHHKLSTPSRT